jgi:DMSO/TMAO reductase YedYZ molybdopterin-dependent catalytic subunit
MASFFNRGFGRKRSNLNADRIPPGQYETHDWPVLTAGPTPQPPLTTWTFSLDGLIESPVQWSWEQFNALPQQAFTNDIHCVTKWSKLDTHWRGVSVETLLEHVTLKPEVRYVMAYSYGDYSTNIPLEDLRQSKTFIGLQFEEKPLAPEHGGPARLVVPHLYFWKSAKWIKGLRFMEQDQPGFWEQGGYSMHGNPWTEQRYRSDD